MLSEKVRQTTSDILSRLDEMKKTSTDDAKVWAGRQFVYKEGDREYLVDVTVRLI